MKAESDQEHALLIGPFSGYSVGFSKDGGGMPKLTVTRETSLSSQEAFEKITHLLENDKELNKLDPGYKCDFDSGSLSGTAVGKQFKAKMHIKDKGSGSEVELLVDLPMTLTLVKGLVKSTLQKKVDAVLPA
jgi:hypothetical protein